MQPHDAQTAPGNKFGKTMPSTVKHNGGDQAEPPDATQFFIALGRRIVEHAVELGLFRALLLLDGLLLLRGVAARLDVDARGGFALWLRGRSGLLGLALDIALVAVVHRVTLRHLDSSFPGA